MLSSDDKSYANHWVLGTVKRHKQTLCGSKPVSCNFYEPLNEGAYMSKAKNQITPAIEEQIYSVNYSTGINMLDCHAVMRIADREGCHELADYLSDRRNWPDYKHFILTGDKKGV